MTSNRSPTSRRKMPSVPAAALCVLAILLGAGCGQSGPLFLPAEEPPARTESAAVDEKADAQVEHAEKAETAEETEDREETP